MSLDHREHPAKDAPERVVKVRRLSWREDTVMEFVLRKRHSYVESYDAGDEVYLDGKWLGTVTSYWGSIDTKIKGTRLRRQGVRRKLWGSQRPGDSRTLHGHVSRAEAIRWLLR